MKSALVRLLKAMLSKLDTESAKVEKVEIYPRYLSPFKIWDNMSTQEQARAQDKLDDFLAYAKHDIPKFYSMEEDSRNFFISCFYCGWEGGFWDSYLQRDDDACYNAGKMCYDAGQNAGKTRAMLWAPPQQS